MQSNLELMPGKSQLGFAPILIVVLLAIVVGSSVLIIKNIPFNQPKPQPTEKQSTDSAQVKISPSTTISKTSAITISKTPTRAPTGSTSTNNSNNSNSTPTNLPSPSISPNSTAQPSPVPGTYHLDLQPTSDIQILTSSQGYTASILLKDSTGNTVYDQSDFSFSASIDNPIATASLLSEENERCKINNIRYATSGYELGICPNFVLSIDPKDGNFQAGSAKIPVKATQKSTGKVVAEGEYSLTIK